MNDHPRISCQLPLAPAGEDERERERLSKPSSEPGLKKGRPQRRTCWVRVSSPRTVANVAPRRIPSQQGMNITSSKIVATTKTSTGTSAPNLELIGPNEPPKLISNNWRM